MKIRNIQSSVHVIPNKYLLGCADELQSVQFETWIKVHYFPTIGTENQVTDKDSHLGRLDVLLL
jgi:hypothetical protein